MEAFPCAPALRGATAPTHMPTHGHNKGYKILARIIEHFNLGSWTEILKFNCRHRAWDLLTHKVNLPECEN